MKTIQVGLLGIGTVGGGTFQVLQRNQQEIRDRVGSGIEITMVADLDMERARSMVGEGVQVVDDARAVIANPDIDVVVELIGGTGMGLLGLAERVELAGGTFTSGPEDGFFVVRARLPWGGP